MKDRLLKTLLVGVAKKIEKKMIKHAKEMKKKKMKKNFF